MKLILILISRISTDLLIWCRCKDTAALDQIYYRQKQLLETYSLLLGAIQLNRH